MNKYLIPENKDGKDQIGIATKKTVAELNDKYKGRNITSPCILIGRSDYLYAMIWKHKCGEYVMYSVSPLRHKTALRVVNILKYGKDAVKLVKEWQKICSHPNKDLLK